MQMIKLKNRNGEVLMVNSRSKETHPQTAGFGKIGKTQCHQQLDLVANTGNR